MIDSASYGPLLSLLWTPIVAVTASWEGKRNGQIAVSTIGASIVPDRPRLFVQLYKTNLTHELVSNSSALAINLLRDDQLDLVHRLGFVSGRDVEKLAEIPHALGPSGSPVLTDCLGWLDCRVVTRMDTGDSTGFLAELVSGRRVSEGAPLFWREARARMPEAWRQEWEEKIAGEIEIARQTML